MSILVALVLLTGDLRLLNAVKRRDMQSVEILIRQKAE